jgi:polyhydroxyalkanoate synthase
MAVTEGAVVYENEYFQLLQYKPLTDKVYERPLLMVPPCINKFYILDLQPESSLVRHAVEQGNTVFLVSWRNPDASMAERTWDDYIEHAAIRAIEVTRDISGQDKINVLGFCVGGTIVSTALAVLAARGERPSQPDAADHAARFRRHRHPRRLRRRSARATARGHAGRGRRRAVRAAARRGTGQHVLVPAPERPGLELRGRQLPQGQHAGSVRPAVLEWRRHQSAGPVVLLVPAPYVSAGRAEGAGQAHGVQCAGGPGAIDVPTYIYGSREDHIVPWAAAYASTAALLRNKLRFVLGASGHIAGVINPPAKKKRSHWTNDKLSESAHDWLAGAQEHPGSWWPDWVTWLGKQAGRSVPRQPITAMTTTGRSNPRQGATSNSAPELHEGRPATPARISNRSAFVFSKGHQMTDIVIVSAARTAVGKFGGSLAKIPAPELGAIVIKAALERAGVKPTR